METLPKLVQFIFLDQTIVVSVGLFIFIVVSVGLKINKNPARTSAGDSSRAADDPSCLQVANEKKDVFFDNPLSPISAVHTCGVIYWSTGSVTMETPTEKTDSFSPSSYQMPITPN